jgi:hypothetical protein
MARLLGEHSLQLVARFDVEPNEVARPGVGEQFFSLNPRLGPPVADAVRSSESPDFGAIRSESIEVARPFWRVFVIRQDDSIVAVWHRNREVGQVRMMPDSVGSSEYQTAVRARYLSTSATG